MKKVVPFEQILRPLFEARAVVAWTVAGLWCLGWALGLRFATGTIFLLVLMCLALAGWRLKAAYALAKKKVGLIGRPLAFLSTAQLTQTMPRMGNNLWLGWGYRWEPSHTRRAAEVMKRNLAEIYPPTWVLRLLGIDRDPIAERGMQWIHGLEATEGDVLVPLESLKGHMAIIATTGALKTRLVALIMPQLVARGDTVIVIDPKGDSELRAICKAACDATGRPDKFLMFHPAFASQSTRLDLLKNWDRVSQVASRLSLVIDSQENSTFKDFCWTAVHAITNGMKYVGRRVSIVNLKTAMQTRAAVERLTEDCLKKFFDLQKDRYQDRIAQEVAKQTYAGEKKPQRGRPNPAGETGSAELAAMLSVFSADVGDDPADARKRGIPEKPDEIKGLIAILEANKEWFGKMIVSIIPMLTKLSTDDLKGLLSPDYEDLADHRPIMDSKRIVQGNHVLYAGTDTLADTSVGHTLAAMLLADVSAVAAELYNHGIEGDKGETPRRIHVIVDEWGDVMCEPLIQQANKGRGAGIFIWALGQTFADLVDALGGSQPKAYRFMGNMNNMIVGATSDQATMQLVSEKFGTTAIEQRSQSQSTGSKTEDVGLEFSVNRGETISERVTELFPPSLLPSMPDLQYIALFNRSERIKGRIPIVQLT
jgi:conjugal transfer pilus assembly protein TraD